MADDEELFTHEVEAWTVGDLREAMKHAPDEMPLRVFLAEEPGGGTCDEQVVFAGSQWNSRGDKDAPPDCFSIETDFPPGQYYRRRSNA